MNTKSTPTMTTDMKRNIILSEMQNLGLPFDDMEFTEEKGLFFISKATALKPKTISSAKEVSDQLWQKHDWYIKVLGQIRKDLCIRTEFDILSGHEIEHADTEAQKNIPESRFEIDQDRLIDYKAKIAVIISIQRFFEKIDPMEFLRNDDKRLNIMGDASETPSCLPIWTKDGGAGSSRDKRKEVELKVAGNRCWQIEKNPKNKKTRKKITEEYLMKHRIVDKPEYKPEMLAKYIFTINGGKK